MTVDSQSLPHAPTFSWRMKKGRISFSGPLHRPLDRRRHLSLPFAVLPRSLRDWLELEGQAAGPHRSAQFALDRRVALFVSQGHRQGIVVDLTAWHRAKGHLVDHNRLLEEGIEALPEAFVLYDAADRLLIANSRYAELYPSIADMARRGVAFDAIVRQSVARGQFQLGLETSEEWIKRREAFHRSGDDFFEQHLADGRWVRLSERRTRSGGVASIRSDITLLKQREQALSQARQEAEMTSRSMSRFLAVFSHEVRNGLNGLVGAAQMLAMDARDTGHREQAELLFQSSGRLTRVLSDLLDFLKNEATGVHIHPHEMDPRDIVASVCRQFDRAAQSRSLTLEQHVADDVWPMVQGDAARIQQVLTNLVSNAIKYSEQGRVVVALRRCEAGLRYTVSDEGVGIEASKLDGLFDFFSRASPDNPNSTGLGLAISRQLVVAMGGHIDVRSSPGDGSEFWFELPLAPTSRRQPASDSAAEPVATRTLVVGVLDDDPLSRYVAQGFLHRLGHRAVLCTNGGDALRQVQDAGLDALLLDLMLVDEQGIDVARRLRASPGNRFERLAIVVVTGNVLPDIAEACRSAGADAVVQKPLFIGELDQVLQSAVAARGGPPGSHSETMQLADAVPLDNVAESQAVRAVLAQLRADIGKRYFQRSVESAIALFAELADQLASAGPPIPPQRLHRLHGTASQLGLVSLSRLAAAFEQAAGSAAPAGPAHGLHAALVAGGALLREVLDGMPSR